MDKTELKYSFKDLRTDLGLNDVKSRCDKSSFDILLGQLWESGMENGLFRYKLSKNCLAFKVLPGKFRYVAQVCEKFFQKNLHCDWMIFVIKMKHFYLDYLKCS